MHTTSNLLNLFIYSLIAMQAESQCGDWTAYRDIKCFKIFESSGLQTYDDAINTCLGKNFDSNLIKINSTDEQSFITTYLFTTNNVVDNVWIGAKYVNSHYQWLNGMNLTFTNWAEGYPKNLTDDCVEMNSDPGLVGKWVDTSCKRKNLVVCEKLLNWSINHIQESVINLQEMVKDLTEMVSILRKNESVLQETVSSLKQNLISIGFIYVQFPNEKTPQEIWSWMTWQEITSSYAGLFFRAFGGNSSSFGSTQDANAPRITQIESEQPYLLHNANRTNSGKTIEEGWSEWIYSGGDYFTGDAFRDMRFYTNGGEVRPINTAIRIWKRIA